MSQSADVRRFFTRFVKQVGALPFVSAFPWRYDNGGMASQNMDPGSFL